MLRAGRIISTADEEGSGQGGAVQRGRDAPVPSPVPQEKLAVTSALVITRCPTVDGPLIEQLVGQELVATREAFMATEPQLLWHVNWHFDWCNCLWLLCRSYLCLGRWRRRNGRFRRRRLLLWRFLCCFWFLPGRCWDTRCSKAHWPLVLLLLRDVWRWGEVCHEHVCTRLVGNFYFHSRNHLKLTCPAKLALAHEIDLDSFLLENQRTPGLQADLVLATTILPMANNSSLKILFCLFLFLFRLCRRPLPFGQRLGNLFC
mmetsp:Transcript_82899/g.146767  ORF Transcript_82899/g.146767 Transcript_82899/m.146767 type:complete len:260 (-) Transcript_82899:1030-1809(-)